MKNPKPILFKTQHEWRKWLEVNHGKFTEAYLIHYKKSSTKTGINYNEALSEALSFGWIDGKLKSRDKESFILRYSPRKANSVWSQINKDKALQLIKEGKMTAAGLAKIAEAKKSGTWYQAYTNKKLDALPSDLKQALLKNKKAYENFKKFSNTNQNMYIGWVNNAKQVVTRKKRITEVVNRAFQQKKPAEF